LSSRLLELVFLGVEAFFDPFPSLIIQDEAHLLEESLGTFAGLFETMLEQLLVRGADLLGDRVVFLFIYMPILRHEYQKYADIRNAKKIRKQSKKPNSIPGRPNVLYDSEPRGGFPINPELYRQLLAKVDGFSK
jgi:hypothetical protein